MTKLRNTTLIVAMLFTYAIGQGHAESKELRQLINKMSKMKSEKTEAKDMAKMEELAEEIIKKTPKEAGPAHYYLGEIYTQAKGQEVKNLPKALEMLRLSLKELGPKNRLRPYAHYQIGWIYFQKDGIEQNFDSAYVHFEKAQEQNKKLIKIYALMSELGLGTNKDPGFALTCYEEGISAGQYLYQEADATRYAIEQAIAKKLDQKNYEKFQSFMMMTALNNDEPTPEAITCLKEAADAGYTPAQYYYGSLMAEGKGMDKNIDEAIKIFKSAAEKGYKSAINDYVIYTDNQGKQPITEEHFNMLKKAADEGYPLAQNNIGDFYIRGKGVKRNDDEAYKWFYVASKQGLPIAVRTIQQLGANMNIEKRDKLEAEAKNLPMSIGESAKLLNTLSHVPTFSNEKISNASQKPQQGGGNSALNASFYQSQYNKYGRKLERELKSAEPRADYVASLRQTLSSLVEQANAKGFSIERKMELENTK